MNEIAKRQDPPRDNFDYDPLAEYAGSGGGADRPARSMQGETKLKYVDPDWTADGVPCNDRVLVVYDRTYAAVHWGDGAPIEVRPLVRGETPPDLKALNAAIPKDEWREGFNGQPEPPWQLQRVLEFLDPETAERLSWPANVTVAGSSRAAEELEGRIKIVRRLRGEDVYPRVRLTHRFMPTKFGGRERPYRVGKVRRTRRTDRGRIQHPPREQAKAHRRCGSVSRTNAIGSGAEPVGRNGRGQSALVIVPRKRVGARRSFFVLSFIR
jgi:hypothetical protein